jgi:DNA-binding Xre family transcriptional regulator
MASAMATAIRGHMGRQRMSGNVLAAKIGVSQNYLAKRLRDDAPLAVSDVEAICAALSVPMKDLINETVPLAARNSEGASRAISPQAGAPG